MLRKSIRSTQYANSPCSSAHRPRIPKRCLSCISRRRADAWLCTSSVPLVMDRGSAVRTYAMPTRYETALHILQAELAQPQPSIRDTLIFLGIRCRIPCIDIVNPKSDRLDLLAGPVGCECVWSRTRCGRPDVRTGSRQGERLLQNSIA